MLRKNTKELKRNRSLMAQHMSPNIVKYVELERAGRAKSALVRIMILKERNGTFSVGSIRVGHKIDRYACSYTPDVGNFEQLYFATEKLEEMSTVLELGGYECVDEFEDDIFNVTDLRYQSVKPSTQQGIAFFHAHRNESDNLFCQLVPGGLHVLVKIDAYGAMAVHDFNSENVSVEKENLINGRVKSYLRTIMQKEGFRGALLEGFFDGKNLYIVDAGYLHNKSLFKTKFEARVKYINDMLASHEQEDGCRFIYPTTGDANKWTATYRFGLNKGAFIKRKGSAFCVQPSTEFGQRYHAIDAGVMLTEGKVLGFIGNKTEDGILSGSDLNNIKNKLSVFYPCKEQLVRPNEYNVIGYDDTQTTAPLLM